MKVNITYPTIKKRKMRIEKVTNIIKWLILVATIICPIINIVTGGKAWSLVVLMSLYMFWTLILSPDLVEYNRISQFVKLITLSCILLIIIDICLVSGWALEVVGNVGFCGLIVSGILFFTDLERQKQNMQPLLFFIFTSIISSIVALCIYQQEERWAVAVMGGIALILLVTIVIVLKDYLLKELKKRFHIE